MSVIKTPPSNEKYREGWDRIFGENKEKIKGECPRCHGLKEIPSITFDEVAYKKECPFCRPKKGKIDSKDEYEENITDSLFDEDGFVRSIE